VGLQSVLHVRFDSQRMVSCSKDKSIVIWHPVDVRCGTEGQWCDGCVALVPRPTRLPLQEDGFQWKLFRKLTGHIAAVNVVEFDHRYIVSASGDRTIRLVCVVPNLESPGSKSW
jgi:F-box and WD-40 domain protein 1/11